MKAEDEAETMEEARWWRRVGRSIRRHPWRVALLLPLAVLLYTLALLPFTPSIGDIKKAKQEQASVVLSADGKELAVFRRANRDWVALDDIAPAVKQALLATEDRRFYDHHGIDFVRTGKAVLNTLTGEREGGSTITQQLARNLYPEQIGRAPTITRKLKEAITALKIEAVYSKDEILESYLNSVSFLYNAWGIEMAAQTYYGKRAKDLNELEAATLIGMLKGTAYYNPVLNPDRALQRRNTVLSMMVDEKVLDEARSQKLKAQPLKLDFERMPEFNGPAPHLAEYLRQWLTDWADRNDYNIYADGLVVRTTIDSRLQDMANEAVQRQGKALQAVADVEWSRSSVPSLGSDTDAYLAARGKAAPFGYFWDTHKDLVTEWIRESASYKKALEEGQEPAQALAKLRADADFVADLRRQKTRLQAGFVAIEPNTGRVLAWVGSRDYATDKFDHVQQARRQPGSTFKPFVYGAAFEAGMSPDEMLMDEPVTIQIDRNKTWRPTDLHGSSHQPMTLREGLAQSKNTITAQLMMRVGPTRVASLARAMGVRQSSLEAVPSLALGTSPVTLKEMVSAFGTIANGGSYVEPIIVTAVEDRHHRVLASFGSRPAEQALSSQAAMTLLDVMRGVIDGGTAAGLRPRFGLTGDLAGKTGTTQDNTDGWFILMHPQVVAGAWMGFNDARVNMRSDYWGQGGHNALLVVGDFMRQGEKAKVIDARLTFAAPHRAPQEQPLMDRMGDWWSSVFNAPSPLQGDPEVAALPELPALPQLDLGPPQLVPAPAPMALPQPDAEPYPTPLVLPAPPLPADAAVIVAPQRVPSFSRPLEATGAPDQPRAQDPSLPLQAARPADTITGTRVYPAPQASVSRRSEPPVTTDASRRIDEGAGWARNPGSPSGSNARSDWSSSISGSGSNSSPGPVLGSGSSAAPDPAQAPASSTLSAGPRSSALPSDPAADHPRAPRTSTATASGSATWTKPPSAAAAPRHPASSMDAPGGRTDTGSPGSSGTGVTANRASPDPASSPDSSASSSTAGIATANGSAFASE